MADLFDRNTLFCRMIGLLTQEQLDSLERKTVAFAGAGGVGFTHAESIVREGIGGAKISDFDAFGAENMGRQFGCSTLTVGRDKAEVLEERLKTINPALRINRIGAITRENVGQFLDGVDIACDAIDYFSIEPHRLYHAEAHRRGVPSVLGAPQGYGATLHFFHPDHMSFDEYFDLHDGQPESEQMENWGEGLGPAQLYRHYLSNRNLDVHNKTGSVISAVCLLSTALVSAVVLRYLLGQESAFKPVPYIYHIDLVAGRFEEMYVPEGSRGIRADPGKYLR
ncbi:MAG: ThiF family adenylyltransferase [Stellaceae bacterium]